MTRVKSAKCAISVMKCCCTRKLGCADRAVRTAKSEKVYFETGGYRAFFLSRATVNRLAQTTKQLQRTRRRKISRPRFRTESGIRLAENDFGPLITINHYSLFATILRNFSGNMATPCPVGPRARPHHNRFERSQTRLVQAEHQLENG